MKKPYFSIVLPTYNRAHLLSRAIESVLTQTFTEWELLIVDDGSTDNTKQEVEKFTDNRIQYIWQQNCERSAARNNGISLSKGEFVCFLDSDDLWRENHLQTHFNKIKSCNESKAFYFTGMTWNFPDRKQDVIFESPEAKNPVEYVISNQIGTPTVCIHHSILKLMRFNTALRINEDVELFARIVAEYPFVQIPFSTVDVLIHEENTKAKEKDYISPQIKAMETIFGNSGLKNKISYSFKKKCVQNLRHQLINHYFSTKEYAKMRKEIVRFLILYPTHFQNKSKIVLLLYYLPCGFFLQKTIAKLKHR